MATLVTFMYSTFDFSGEISQYSIVEYYQKLLELGEITQEEYDRFQIEGHTVPADVGVEYLTVSEIDGLYGNELDLIEDVELSTLFSRLPEAMNPTIPGSYVYRYFQDPRNINTNGDEFGFRILA